LVYSTRRAKPKPGPLALARLSRYFPPAVAKVYIVSFRTHDDRRPSKFIVLADNMKSASPWLGSMEGRTSNRGPRGLHQSDKAIGGCHYQEKSGVGKPV